VRPVSLRVVGNPELMAKILVTRKPDTWPHCPVSSAKQVNKTRTEHNTFNMTLENTRSHWFALLILNLHC
jgi:hypothetical protein